MLTVDGLEEYQYHPGGSTCVTTQSCSVPGPGIRGYIRQVKNSDGAPKYLVMFENRSGVLWLTHEEIKPLWPSPVSDAMVRNSMDETYDRRLMFRLSEELSDES